MIKNLPANAGDVGSIPGWGRSSGGGSGSSVRYSCLGKSHGRGSLVGYSAWGLKELDTTSHKKIEEQGALSGEL